MLEVRQVLVDATRERPRRRVVTEVHAGRADRRDRDVDPRFVEVGDRAVETPAWGSDASRGIPVLVRGLPIELGNHVLVKVDGEAHVCNQSS